MERASTNHLGLLYIDTNSYTKAQNGVAVRKKRKPKRELRRKAPQLSLGFSFFPNSYSILCFRITIGSYIAVHEIWDCFPVEGGETILCTSLA